VSFAYRRQCDCEPLIIDACMNGMRFEAESDVLVLIKGGWERMGYDQVFLGLEIIEDHDLLLTIATACQHHRSR